MTIKEFKDCVRTGRALGTEDIHIFMDEMSDAAYAKIDLMGHRADPFTESQIDK